MKHHAQLILGHFDERIDMVLDVLESEGIAVQANPDIRQEYYTLFGVGDARRLREAQLHKPVVGDRCVFILGWQQATSQAQNALLKVFEEPAPHAHFFLIVPSVHTLLPTLRSRLEIYSFETSETNEESDTLLFVKKNKTERLSHIEDIIAEKDVRRAAALLDGLEVYYKGQQDVKKYDAFTAIAAARRNLSTRSPSVKLILQQLALVLP